MSALRQWGRKGTYQGDIGKNLYFRGKKHRQQFKEGNTLNSMVFSYPIERSTLSWNLAHLQFNPILCGLKYNLFHARGGIYAPPRDFALSEPIMHRQLRKVKFEKILGHRKRQQHSKSRIVVLAAKEKSCGEKCAKEFQLFQNSFSKVGKFFLVKTNVLNPRW